MIFQMASQNPTMLKDPGFLVIGKKYRLGRKADCSFVINDLSVSRVHAELTANAGSVHVKDLGSMNGTFLNGLRITEADIEPDRVVVFGNAPFQLVGHDLSDLADQSTIAPEQANAGAPLSIAQHRVLEPLLRGCSEKEVARLLDLSPNTVHNHVRMIYSKFGVNSRAELLAKFVSESKFRHAPRK